MPNDPVETVAGTQGAGSHRESADDYCRVIAHLSPSYRVIVCKDGIQWILQRRDGERHGRARWTGVSYCVTRDALIRLCRASSANIEPSAMAALRALPDIIKEAT